MKKELIGCFKDSYSRDDYGTLRGQIQAEEKVPGNTLSVGGNSLLLFYSDKELKAIPEAVSRELEAMDEDSRKERAFLKEHFGNSLEALALLKTKEVGHIPLAKLYVWVALMLKHQAMLLGSCYFVPSGERSIRRIIRANFLKNAGLRRANTREFNKFKDAVPVVKG